MKITKVKQEAHMSTDTVETKRGRGRPPVYDAEARTKIADLVRQHNASRAMAILNAGTRNRSERKLVPVRVAAGFPKKLGISMPTILKIAATAGVTLKVGRPVAQAA
jgi:hypothetical protein